MAIRIESRQVECFGCKRQLSASVKVDSSTGDVRKYLEVRGGTRRETPLGFKATYCSKCATTLDGEHRNVQHSVTTTAQPRIPESLGIGDRVKHLMKPEWGIGRVIALSDDDIRVYFVNVGERGLKLWHEGKTYNHLAKVQGEEAKQPLLDIFDAYSREDGHHNIYVIQLNSEVLREAVFRLANHGYDMGKPCLYVGLTGLTPEERFINHKLGHKSSHYPHRYGVKLLPAFYECFNPMNYEVAQKMEEVLARSLRAQGFAVWQN